MPTASPAGAAWRRASARSRAGSRHPASAGAPARLRSVALIRASLSRASSTPHLRFALDGRDGDSLATGETAGTGAGHAAPRGPPASGLYVIVAPDAGS